MGSISTNWRDVRAFGLGVLARHLGRFSGDRTGVAYLRDVGRVTVRPHQSDMACLRQVFVEQQYDLTRYPEAEVRISARYEAILAAGSTPVIIDGGANIGAASLWFARKYPKAVVLAVEPDPSSFALLARNTRGDIRPVAAALGAEPGFVEICTNDQAWTTKTVRAETGLLIVTVDELLRSVPGGQLFIAKIDIEGFESDLFSSKTGWVSEAWVIYIELHDWLLPGEGSSRPVMKALTPHGFEIYIAGENLAFVKPR